MKNLKRKGFTIVELVIVIAVIAVLAAVLIPTFSNVINKANFTSDISAVRNMNTILSVAQVTDGKVDSVSEAITALSEAGFTTEDLKATTTGYEFYWNSTYNVILLVDCSKADEDQWEVVYPKEGYEEAIAEFDNLEKRSETNFLLADFPNATVSPIDNLVLAKGEILESDGGNLGGFKHIDLPEGSNFPLDIALNFLAKDTPEEAQAAPYGNWYVDFIISVDKDFNDEYADTEFYLAGQYSSFLAQWIVIDITDVDVEAGAKYPLLGIMGMPFTYVDICRDVVNFNCGVGTTGLDPEGLNITIQLVMFETGEDYNKLENYHVIYEYTHSY